MTATITTYGGERATDGLRTVTHWQLSVDGEFIADTSDERHAILLIRIANALNNV